MLVKDLLPEKPAESIIFVNGEFLPTARRRSRSWTTA